MSKATSKGDIAKGGGIGAILVALLEMSDFEGKYLTILQLFVPAIAITIQKTFDFFHKYFDLDPAEMKYRRVLKASIKQWKERLKESPPEERKIEIQEKIHKLEDEYHESLIKRKA